MLAILTAEQVDLLKSLGEVELLIDLESEYNVVFDVLKICRVVIAGIFLYAVHLAIV